LKLAVINLCFSSSPAAKTECGALPFNFFVVFDDCPTKKSGTSKKFKCAEDIDLEIVTTIAFRRKIPVLSARLPPKPSVETRLLAFFVVFDV
jgi:hypothetical protein